MNVLELLISNKIDNLRNANISPCFALHKQPVKRMWEISLHRRVHKRINTVSFKKRSYSITSDFLN